MKQKQISGYQVRTKDLQSVRYWAMHLNACKSHCYPGNVVVSCYSKVYGIKLRFYWQEPYRGKVKYDKAISTFNFFKFHIHWELMKRDAMLEVVYEAPEEPMA